MIFLIESFFLHVKKIKLSNNFFLNIDEYFDTNKILHKHTGWS